HQVAVLVFGGGGGQHRHRIIRVLVGWHVPELGGNIGRVLERFVHVEHVVGGCQDHFFLVGENHRLQYVHRLRDVGHAHAIRVLVKNVEVDGRHQRVAQGVLLI